MNYEKAYKDALERAKNIRFGNPNSATANVVCEEIFPELKESEDARKLDVGEMERWTNLHNKGANLYHVNSAGELKEVPAAGWWY